MVLIDSLLSLHNDNVNLLFKPIRQFLYVLKYFLALSIEACFWDHIYLWLVLIFFSI